MSLSAQNEMTPLVAIAAAKWRWMTFDERERELKRREAIELKKQLEKVYSHGLDFL